MKMTENLELDPQDIERMLGPILRGYRFYSKGQLPEKIIFPVMDKITVQTEHIPPEFKDVKVEFLGVEDAARRLVGAKRAYPVGKAVSTSNHPEPEPNSKK